MKIPHKYDVGQIVLFITETSTNVPTRCEQCGSILHTAIIVEETDNVGRIFGLKYMGQKIFYLISNLTTSENLTVSEDRVVKDLDEDA
jgi:hypothetical protein